MNKLLILVSVVVLSACSTMQPPRYSVSVDNIQKLKSYKVSIADVNLTQATEYQPNCRLMGPIEPADGLSIPQFVSKAFNDEIKMAGVYSTNGVKLTGEITKIKFSSVEGLTNGYWDIGLKLNSSNGSSLTIDNKYTFKSGFDAITACNATADALSPAVQDLIKATVNHPQFMSLFSDS